MPARQTLLKALANLSDTTARRSVVDRDNLKPYWKSEKGPPVSRRSASLLFFISISKTLLTTQRRLAGLQTFLAVGLSTEETFQQSGKQDPFSHIMKSSASIYEIFGSTFFRTTVRSQSVAANFDKLRFVMAILTILGNTKMFRIGSKREDR